MADLSNYLIVGRRTDSAFSLVCMSIDLKNLAQCTFKRTFDTHELSDINAIAAQHSTECTVRNSNAAKSSEGGRPRSTDG